MEPQFNKRGKVKMNDFALYLAHIEKNKREQSMFYTKEDAQLLIDALSRWREARGQSKADYYVAQCNFFEHEPYRHLVMWSQCEWAWCVRVRLYDGEKRDYMFDPIVEPHSSAFDYSPPIMGEDGFYEFQTMSRPKYKNFG